MSSGFHDTACAKASDHSKDCTCALKINYVQPKTIDPVNPAHYKDDTVMKIIEEFGLGFCLGNVVKYILRHKAKAGLEDLKKARWYLDREISRMEGAIK